MTFEEIGILIILYVFALIIVIQTVRLWLVQASIKNAGRHPRGKV